MIRMELSEDDATILGETLKCDLSELYMEIAHTELQPFREELKHKEIVLRHVLQSLENSGIHPE